MSYGAKVVVFDLAAERFPIDEFESKDALLAVTVDITRRDSIEAGLHEVIARWDTPHGLINNAALDAPPNSAAGRLIRSTPRSDEPNASSSPLPMRS